MSQFQSSSLKTRFDMTTAQEQKECSWYSTRLNSIGALQAVVVAAAAFLFNKESDGKQHQLLYGIILLGFVTSLVSLVSMGVTCYVFRQLLHRLRQMIEEDRLRPIEEQELQDCFHADRKLPDLMHFLSVDVSAYLIPGAFLVFWLGLGIWCYSQ